MEKSLAKEMCIKFKSEEIRQLDRIAARVIRKRKRCGHLRCVWTKRFGKRYIDCQQGEAKRSQDRVTVVNRHHYHCSSCRFVCKSRCFYTCFCIACYFVHVIYVAILYMNYPRRMERRLRIFSKFCKGVYWWELRCWRRCGVNCT